MAQQQNFKPGSKERQMRYFSESFKKDRVRQLERNQTTIGEISREFEVTRTAVYKWLYQYSSMKKRGIRQVVEPLSDAAKVKHLKERIKELEQLVGQKQIEIEFRDKQIEIAEEIYGVEIKKKPGSKPSNGSGSTAKNTRGK